MSTMEFQIKQGKRTHIDNRNSGAWRVQLRTTGGTLLEFDVVLGGSFVITSGPDVERLQIDVQDAPAGLRSAAG